MQLPNGDFSSPHVLGTNWSMGTPAHWGGNGATISADAAKHPDGLQAANLNFGGGPAKLYVNLWGVHTGEQVTLRFDDSPSTYTGCTLDQVQHGQQFTIDDGHKNEVMSTKGASAVGTPKWEIGKEYTFTASEDNARVNFASKMPQGTGLCGPMLTNVRAERVPAPPSTGIRKVELPAPEAYSGNEPLPIAAAVDYCNGSETQCSFTEDEHASYPYYDKAQMAGEVHLNCGRNAFEDDRDVTYTEKTFDSLTQYYPKHNLVMVPSDAIAEAKPKLADQVARGFEEASDESWSFGRDVKRYVAPTIQPGEASWIEVEPARERLVGNFTGSTNDFRLFAVFDAPSDRYPDRWYQRTGPMTQAELAMCSSGRRTTITPARERSLVAMAPRSGMSAAGNFALKPKDR
ncbi:hypothetical protein ACFV2N_41535 [Streptomyces sp. NPDC059680]|uniref:hypothetical protein n=1 Tax=Streptomyces sp. NPDC059680 TaxID=3346904 RepID=UPI003686CC0E